MSSAPTGFSISYHKRMTKGNDNLRIQAALGRFQQQSKQGTANGGGTNQLLVCQYLKKNSVHSSFHFLFFFLFHSLSYSRV
jgi:hypothetical protein